MEDRVTTPDEPADDPRVSATQKASKYLRSLLAAPRAKKIWCKYLPENISPDTQVLSYRAIARSISAFENQRYGVEDSPNRYKDRVRRAIIGQRLTADTVQLFAETFDFNPQQTSRLLGHLSVAKSTPVKSQKVQNRPGYEITSTFNDFFFDSQQRVYRCECSMVILAIQDGVDSMKVLPSKEVQRIDLLEGGTCSWNEEEQVYCFQLDYPLKAQEVMAIRYELELDPTIDQENGLLMVQYMMPRPANFFRLIFDDPATAPEEVIAIRDVKDSDGSPIPTRLSMPVYEGRCSLHLDTIYHEDIYFYDLKDL